MAHTIDVLSLLTSIGLSCMPTLSLISGKLLTCFQAFAILRAYGIMARDWKPLILVVPLAMIQPALLLVGWSYVVNDWSL